MKIMVDGKEVEVLNPEEVAAKLGEVTTAYDEKINKLSTSLEDLMKKAETKPKDEPKVEEKDKKDEEDFDSIIEKKMAIKESEKAFKSFKTSIGAVEGLDIEMFKGLNPTQFEAIQSLVTAKKTLSETEFDALVEAKATEKAKLIVEGNDKEQKDKKDKVTPFAAFKVKK